MADLGREGGEKLFGVIEHGLVQIARMGVEQCGLPGNRLNDVRVTVADRRHIIIGVEIGIALGIVEPDAFATDELHRLLVEQPIGWSEQAIAARDDVSGRDGLVDDRHVSYSELPADFIWRIACARESFAIRDSRAQAALLFRRI